MLKVRYQLHHSCDRPGCQGGPGDIIELDEENARWFEKYVVPGRGATRLDAFGDVDDEDFETADDEPVAEARRGRRASVSKG